MRILVMSVFLVVGAYAKQPAVPKPLTVDDIIARMKFQLGLTDDQAAKVKPIIKDYMQQERKLKINEVRALSKVLTSDQMFTWKFLQNEPPKDKKHKGL
jgi:hypothetical protein